MDQYEEKLKGVIGAQKIAAEHLGFDMSCHSVEEAAAAARAAPEDFIKSICMLTRDMALVVAIVKGEDRASTSKVSAAIKELGMRKARLANPDEILAKTGYPCGGVPPFGFEATFLVDPRVMERETIYMGGGSEKSLVKMTPAELVRINRARIVEVRV